MYLRRDLRGVIRLSVSGVDILRIENHHSKFLDGLLNFKTAFNIDGREMIKPLLNEIIINTDMMILMSLAI